MSGDGTRKDRFYKKRYPWRKVIMLNLFSKEEWLNNKYVIGIASTPEEIDAAYKLRYEIFNLELKEGIKENEKTLRDIDKFDSACDHLIIRDLEIDKVIATYRIHPSWKMHKDGFYTSTEFDISKLQLHKRRAIEVGRACVQQDHRVGNLLVPMLWMGLKRYCDNNKVEALFGVASVPKCSAEELTALYNDLVAKGALLDDGRVTPLPDQTAELVNNAPETYRKELLGSLIKGYIKMGASLLGKPIFDPIFGCYDFFVLLEMKDVNWTFVESFAKLFV
jgi:L-ornithine Nalpha-acyltransferase